MTLRIGTAARNAIAAALASQVDVGPGPGIVRVYTAPQPADPQTAPGAAVLIAEFTLADPSFTGPAAGTMTLDATPPIPGTGLATGTAAWGRVLDSTGVAVYDGTVTATGGGGDFIMITTAVATGQPLQIIAGSLTAPAS